MFFDVVVVSLEIVVAIVVLVSKLGEMYAAVLTSCVEMRPAPKLGILVETGRVSSL